MTEWDAAAYSKISGLQKAMADEALALLHLKGSERILDVGCGNGRITRQLAERAPDVTVVGVDASKEMIAFASSNLDPGIGDRLRFETADGRYLLFQDEFDLVVSFNALHWIPEQAMALRSIRAALKDNGWAQLRLVPKGERKSLEDVLEDTRKSARWAQYFARFNDPYLHLTPDQYAELAEANGFRVRALQTTAKIWDFASREAFFGFGNVTFVEWTRLLPESDKPMFINDVLDRYRLAVCDRTGEENTFKFYQMDIQLSLK